MVRSEAEMQADEFVELVLSHPKGGVDALLKITEFQEVDWLEFKASAYDPPNTKEPRHADLQWRIARAVIAMANGRGGCVLVGIADTGETIGIEHSDPQGWLSRLGDDYFLRKVFLEQVLKPQRGWKTTAGRLTPDRPLPDFCTDVRLEPSAGKRVAVIVVHPLLPDAPLLRIVDEDASREFVPVRQLGHVGCVRDLFRAQEIRDHAAQRLVQSPQYASLWARFQTEINDDASTLENEVNAYFAAVKETLRRLREEYIDLHGKEGRSGVTSDLTVPQAEEVIRWLDPENVWSSPSPSGHEVMQCDSHDAPPPDRVPRQGNVIALLESEPRAILLGHPGAGKTTCLQRIALHSADAYQPGGIVTIFAPLAAFRRAGLFALLRRVSNISLGALERLAASRRLCLLLDGLNECPADLAGQCALEVTTAIERFPDLRIVLATRTVSYRDQIRLPIFALRPISEQQQLAMLSVRTGDSNRAAALLQRLRQVPGASSFISNPQLLFIVSQVAVECPEVPSSRAILYNSYTSQWFAREERKARNSGDPLEWSWPVALAALAHLAFQMRLQGRIVCSLAFVRRTLEGMMSDPLHFIDRIAQGLLFKVDRFQGTFSFEHETIQEFLCACHMSARPDCLRTVIEAYNDARELWAMPIVFLFERTEPSPETIRLLWHCDPLLVTVALRDDATLGDLKIDFCRDPWLRGVVKSMKGEPVAETALLKDRDLTGPSQFVKDSLRGDTFWYAGQMHNNGGQRIRRLTKLIREDSEPWADLLKDAFVGHPGWVQDWCDAFDGVFLACSRADAFDQYVKQRKSAPSKLPLQVLARLVYQTTVPNDVWAREAWFRRLFFDGPWFKAPTVLSVRQWKLAIVKGALGNCTRRQHLAPHLKSYLSSLPALAPTLIRLGIIAPSEKLLLHVRQSCLPYLDEADAEHFVRNALIRAADVPEPVLNNWVLRAGPALSLALVEARFISAEVAVYGVGRTWPLDKRRRYLRNLVDRGLLKDASFSDSGSPAKELFDRIRCLLDSSAAPDYREAIREGQIDEALAVLEFPVKDQYDLVYFLAAANLLTAVRNRKHKEKQLQSKRLARDLEDLKTRIAEILYQAAIEGMQCATIHLDCTFSFATLFGLQFSFKELPVKRFAAKLREERLQREQEWSGKRLQPIAPTIMEWARTLRQEHRRNSDLTVSDLLSPNAGIHGRPKDSSTV